MGKACSSKNISVYFPFRHPIVSFGFSRAIIVVINDVQNEENIIKQLDFALVHYYYY